jgi:hypothetical protein
MKHATWLVAALAGFLGGAAGRVVPVLAQSGEKVVQAQAFVLVDAAGNRRGEFRVNQQGQTVLHLYDENGRLSWSAPRMGIVPLR